MRKLLKQKIIEIIYLVFKIENIEKSRINKYNKINLIIDIISNEGADNIIYNKLDEELNKHIKELKKKKC